MYVFSTAERTSYFFVPGGNFDGCRVQIEHVLHLIRLGSESTNIENTAGGVTDGCGQVDGGANGTDGQEFVYVFTPPQVSFAAFLYCSTWFHW